jgi:hypothetical protein
MRDVELWTIWIPRVPFVCERLHILLGWIELYSIKQNSLLFNAKLRALGSLLLAFHRVQNGF